MGDYQNATAHTVDSAATWAGEAARCWLDTYVRLVDGAVSGTTSADGVLRDLSALGAAGARDMARISTTWMALGTALLGLDLSGAPAPPADSPADDTPGGSGGGSGGTP